MSVLGRTVIVALFGARRIFLSTRQSGLQGTHGFAPESRCCSEHDRQRCFPAQGHLARGNDVVSSVLERPGASENVCPVQVL